MGKYASEELMKMEGKQGTYLGLIKEYFDIKGVPYKQASGNEIDILEKEIGHRVLGDNIFIRNKENSAVTFERLKTCSASVGFNLKSEQLKANCIRDMPVLYTPMDVFNQRLDKDSVRLIFDTFKDSKDLRVHAEDGRENGKISVKLNNILLKENKLPEGEYDETLEINCKCEEYTGKDNLICKAHVWHW